MTVVRGLYQRFQRLIHEVAKFGVVGAIAFVVTTVGTNLLHFQVGLGPNTSNVIATIVATFVSYAGNRYWTFRHREGSTMAREYMVGDQRFASRRPRSWYRCARITKRIRLSVIGFERAICERGLEPDSRLRARIERPVSESARTRESWNCFAGR